MRKLCRNSLLNLCVFSIAMLAPAQLDAQIFFQPAQTYSAGVSFGPGGAIAIAVADVNGDGKPDILVAGAKGNSPSVAVLLGNSDGTFQPAQTYSTGVGYNSIAVADVNRDGKPDVIVAGGNGAVLFGNGDGGFQPAQLYQTSTASWAAVADVNGDHIADLLVAGVPGCSFEGSAGVLLGNGDGTFGTMKAYCSGGYQPTSIAVADVNGDGKPDLVVDNSVSVSNGPTVASGYCWAMAMGHFETAFLTKWVESAEDRSLWPT